VFAASGGSRPSCFKRALQALDAVTEIDQSLAAIGFGMPQREPAGRWRAQPDRPAPRRPMAEPEPGCSAVLLRWRDLLARDRRPSPYRITPV
jgi:hypothetical protein